MSAMVLAIDTDPSEKTANHPPMESTKIHCPKPDTCAHPQIFHRQHQLDTILFLSVPHAHRAKPVNNLLLRIRGHVFLQWLDLSRRTAKQKRSTDLAHV